MGILQKLFTPQEPTPTPKQERYQYIRELAISTRSRFVVEHHLNAVKAIENQGFKAMEVSFGEDSNTYVSYVDWEDKTVFVQRDFNWPLQRLGMLYGLANILLDPKSEGTSEFPFFQKDVLDIEKHKEYLYFAECYATEGDMYEKSFHRYMHDQALMSIEREEVT